MNWKLHEWINEIVKAFVGTEEERRTLVVGSWNDVVACLWSEVHGGYGYWTVLFLSRFLCVKEGEQGVVLLLVEAFFKFNYNN